VRWLAPLLLAVGAAPVAHAAGPPGFPVAVTTVSAAQLPSPGATVSLASVPLRCGVPFDSATIVFPATARLPHAIAPALVTVNGTVAASVAVVRRTVRIGLRRAGITCNSISIGPAQIHFAVAARIRLQRGLGTTVTVRYGSRVLRARLTIVPA
jgi:hypothetical protein